MAERISRRRVLTLAAEGAVAFLLVACGEKESSQEATPAKTKTPKLPKTPKATETITNPTAVPTIEPTPTPIPTPEPTPTPEGWSDEEIAAQTAQISSAVNLANTVADELFPESEVLAAARVQAQTAWADYNHIIETKDYASMLTPLDGFISAGRNIGNFACHETYREVEGKAWVELKELALNLSSKYEQSGYLEEGTTQTTKQLLTMPEGCTNQIMLSSQ